MKHIIALVLGALFSICLIKGEAISWYRIQEMFLFESFHMYGIIGSAIAVGALSLQLIKRFQIRTIKGEAVKLPPKPNRLIPNLLGGTLFGFGWAMTGACPGPLYAHVGYGVTIFIAAILSAILGVFVYGLVKDKLPQK